jgi:hypothetical protein
VDALELFLVILAVVVGEVLILAGYVVHRTGSTEGLTAIGHMVARVITALMAR